MVHLATELPPIAADKPWLAPLAGYSDLSLRLLCREYGAACCVTEMVSTKGLVYNSRGTAPLLRTTPQDNPLVVQIFGAESEFIERGMEMLLDKGFKWFDLNCGCPVPKVAKAGSGAKLMRTPKTIAKLARTMVKMAGPTGVSVKMRIGWNATELTYLDTARMLEDEGVAWIALHPRTATMKYSGEADWSHLRTLKETVDIPVIASGDLFTAHDAVRCVQETGVDGIMFARGALKNPSVFSDYHALLRGEELPVFDGLALGTVLRRQAELIKEHNTSKHPEYQMRSIIPRYVKGLVGARHIRQKAIECTTWDAIYTLIEEIETLEPEENGE